MSLFIYERPFNRTLNVNFGNDFQAVLKYNGNIIVSITLTQNCVNSEKESKEK